MVTTQFVGNTTVGSDTTISSSREEEILWSDLTEILWSDGTEILWDWSVLTYPDVSFGTNLPVDAFSGGA